MPITEKLTSANAFKVALQSGNLHVEDKDSKTGQVFVQAGLSSASNTFTGSISVNGDLTVTGTTNVNGSFTHAGSTAGFYGATPTVQLTGVAVSAAGVHAALVTLGLITA